MMYSNADDDHPERLIPWVDIETTGLGPEFHVIAEFGMVITDLNLEPVDMMDRVIDLGSEPSVIPLLFQREAREMHGSRPEGSGLIDDLCRGVGTPLHVVEEEAIAMMHRYFPKCTGADPTKLPRLGGSSVRFDREFMDSDMPNLSKLFHYRLMDVSAELEFALHWAPHVLDGRPEPRNEHRTMPDLWDTIAFAKHLKSRVWGRV